MGRTHLLIWLAVAADGLAALVGGLLSERWLARHLGDLVAFAAGALLGAVFLELLPEAVTATGPVAFRWALAALVGMALLEWRLGHDRHRALPGTTRALPTALLGADALHNIGDGAAVAAAFLVSTNAGVATALAVIVHELPEEVGAYGLLRAAGWSRRRALLALVVVQLTAVVGAGSVLVGSRLVQNLEGVVLALAAGTFLHIATADLMPELESAGGHRGRRVVGFLAGVALLALASALEARLAPGR
ncbi:MAG: ZIP family metal transporter [Myxococcaceae bacterium]|nr:ZIP family metal transporter [Myxococcaceae bacterium]MCI0671608.1 ZIP family metal transporter [Myxococcaceae bacterium]